MKIPLLLTFLALVSVSPIVAQLPPAQWQQPYPIQGATGKSDILDISTDAAGNRYVAGYFDGQSFQLGGATLPGTFPRNGFVARLSPAGVTVWSKTFRMDGLFPQLGIATDAAGNSYVSGTFTDSLQVDTSWIFSKGYEDVFLLRLNSDGDLKWIKGYGSKVNDEIAFFGKGIALAADNGACFTGLFGVSYPSMPDYAVDSIAFGNHLLLNLKFSSQFIVRCDSLGNIQWAKASGEAAQPFGLCTDAAGNVYTTGYFLGLHFELGGQVVTGLDSLDRDAYLARIDPGGTVVWLRALGGHDGDHGLDCAADDQGNVYLLTEMWSDSILVGPSTWIHPGGNLLLKYNSAGIFLWSRTVPGEARSVVVGASGYPTVAGTCTQNCSLPGAPIPQNGPGAYLGQLSSSGDYCWQLTAGGSNLIPSRIALTTSGSGIVAGSSKACPSSFAPYTFCATATSTQLAFAVPFSHPTDLRSMPVQQDWLRVSPVPSTGRLLLETDNPEAIRELSIFTVDGRQILRQRPDRPVKRRQIDISHLSPGTYVLFCTTQDGRPPVRRTIVLK